jgi:hypothetical protein
MVRVPEVIRPDRPVEPRPRGCVEEAPCRPGLAEEPCRPGSLSSRCALDTAGELGVGSPAVMILPKSWV